jgi:hypothetical protein
MKFKNLSKKIRRLEANIAKETKKLEKLRRRLAAGPKASPKKEKKAKAAKTPQPAMPRRPRKKKKQKRNISPERRAQLAAQMKERWAAKRAAAAGADSGPLS